MDRFLVEINRVYFENGGFPQIILLRCPGLNRPPLVGGIDGVADCCFLGDCINAGRRASSGKPSGSAAVLFHCPRNTALSVAHSLAASLSKGISHPRQTLSIRRLAGIRRCRYGFGEGTCQNEA
jgi:hypothetical protein